MNRKLLPMLIALTAAGAAHAADSIPVPTVYGKINVTLNKHDFDDLQSNQSVDGQDNWALESNASRLGVKGDIPLVGDLKAIYKLEYEVFVDDGASDSGREFSQRNIYGGLQGGWGTLIFGKNDTPLKVIGGENIQVFKDLVLGDFKYTIIGENRENNLIQYATPELSGFVFSVATILGENAGASDSATVNESKDQDDGLFDKYSVALTYKINTLSLGLANDHNVQNSDTLRFVATYGLGPVTIGGIYQTAERHYKNPATSTTVNGVNTGTIAPISNLPQGTLTNSSASTTVGNPITDFAGARYDEQDAYGLTAAWKIDNNWTLKGQYLLSKSDPVDAANVGLGETEATNLAIGIDYNITKSSKVFAYYASLEADGDLSATADETLEAKTFGLGYELKF